MKNIIIFDMDGTILNTLDDLAASVNYALRRMGWPARGKDEIRKALGNGVKVLIEKSLPPEAAPEEVLKCVAEFKAYYSKNMYVKTAPYPGIKELFEALKARGCRLAVVSNKFDSAVQELCDIYFKGVFEVAIGESPEVRKKPAPDSVFKALKELKADKKDAVYIGDSEVDYNTALNSGLPCICVTWGFRDAAELEKLGAKFFAQTPAQVLDLIETL
ncbi:MAG: HAD family hydrolase [Elusimicrobiaceae bacterium]|nr:HAD family hydrolase [Elusimicrobiota bacterium]